jgi:hypothetical protein
MMTVLFLLLRPWACNSFGRLAVQLGRCYALIFGGLTRVKRTLLLV